MQHRILEDKKTLLIPATISFILTLLLLYKYTYPISWDVYYHVHMMELYKTSGLVFWDYQTVAPKGRLIMYPPLFHLCFTILSKILNITPMTLSRLAQPIFSFYLIGTITLVSYKLTNTKTALITGFLSMLTFVTFNRSVICTPATIAIGLSMISCTYYYKGFEETNIKQIIISAISFGLICNLHMATAILTMGVIGLYTLILLAAKRINIRYLLIYILISSLIGLPWWIYIATNYTLVFNSIPGNNLSIIWFFFKYYGILSSALLIIGYYTIIKKFNSLSLFLITWTISLILVSQVNYIGVQTVSIRMLEVASYPLILVSGIGLTYILDEIIKDKKIKKYALILIIALSCLSALVYVDSYTPDVLSDNDYNTTVLPHEVHLAVNPVTTLFKPTIISSRFADSNLAHDRYDIMKYFMKQNSTNILVSEDAIMDTIIVSTSSTPVIYGGFTESIPEYVVDPVHIVNNMSTKEELHTLGIEYILLKKNTPIPVYAELTHNNTNYKVCKIKQEYR